MSRTVEGWWLARNGWRTGHSAGNRRSGVATVDCYQGSAAAVDYAGAGNSLTDSAVLVGFSNGYWSGSRCRRRSVSGGIVWFAPKLAGR
jgi:alpha/beta superfamily hydrolase